MSKPDVQTILKLRVPVIVRIGHRKLSLSDVLALGPGAIVELDKHADEELDLLVTTKPIGTGNAVKIGENFGLRLTAIGSPRERIEALAGEADADGA
ncbi:FliM/FliN family flagellar motor switch protein [Phycisphaerales bacterium AB-hyl4]|uniref:Flagellar motor switch protein FliN n=1 Tax=Natronomicrosphaera hydrolytica TaxID=3242702 RepID=A0ABV4U521_9BACT